MDELIGFGNIYVFILWIFLFATFSFWYLKNLIELKVLTIFSYIVIFNFFIPILLNYPFAFSSINKISTGELDYQYYLDSIDKAFLLSFLGFIFFFLGYIFPKPNKTKFLPTKIIYTGIRFWSNTTNSILTFICFILIFLLMYKLGLLSLAGARHEAMEQPLLRPIYNIVHSLLPIITPIFLILGIDKKKRIFLIIAPVVVILGLLTGTRAAALGGILFYILTTLIYRTLKRSIRFSFLVKTGLIGIVLLITAIILGELRKDSFDLAKSFLTIGQLIFYGNNFSDLRDFSWLLSQWNGELVWGKTQLAGFFSFVPSSLFEFRQNWNWGVFSTSMIGLNSETHAGIRPGGFGEPYFNFGYIGIIIAGLFFGYITSRIQNHTINVVSPESQATIYDEKLFIFSALLTANIFWNFLITGGFFGVYIIVGLTLMFSILKIVSKSYYRNPHLVLRK